MKKRLAFAVLAATLATCVGMAERAMAQFQQNDLIVGLSSSSTDSFRQVRQPAGAITPSTPVDSGVLVSGGSAGASPWSRDYIQTVEFDNANHVSHNANGNLLGANFGNAFTGFEIFNFATNGSGSFESLWGVVDATDEAESIRGGGLSVNPSNTRIGWASYDGGQLHVMEYNAGSSVGTGGGGAITGWLSTANGDTLGGSGAFAPLTANSQGTAWLDDDRLMAINGFGELVLWDVSGLSSTDTSAPTTDAGWEVVQTSIFADGQFMDIEYNAEVDPDHVVISRGSFAGGITTNELFVLDAQTFNIVDSIDISSSTNDGDSTATLREIAYDSNGNLFVGGFGENLVSVIPGFADNIGSLSDNSSIDWFNNDFFASFTGLDVAASLPIGGQPVSPGDFNGDGVVDAADYTVWRDNFGGDNSLLLGNGAEAGVSSGVVDAADYDLWVTNYGTHYGSSASAAVPEPLSLSLILLGGVLLGAGRRK